MARITLLLIWALVSIPLAACNDPTASSTIAKAKRQIEAGDHEAAIVTTTTRLERAPAAALTDEAAAQLHYLRARSMEAAQRTYDAISEYEHILRSYSLTKHFVPALEREYEIARLIVRQQTPESIRLVYEDPPEDEDFDTPEALAEELLIRVVERYPGSKLAHHARFELVNLYLGQNDIRSAETVAAAMSKKFPAHPMTEQAADLVARASR
jgi:outer membrane protein assembly factor BamD (BamD/ComL family)